MSASPVLKRRSIALDADGVLLDYNKAAAHVWEKAFGFKPTVRDPGAYHFRNVYDMDLSNKTMHATFYSVFEQTAWTNMSAMPFATEGCQMLHEMGYDLHVVSSMPAAFEHHRIENLRNLGMPIASVTATGGHQGDANPKRATLLKLQPIAFVDDLLSNFRGVHQAMHCALLHSDSTDSPNHEQDQRMKASAHRNLLDFSHYWSTHSLHTCGARS